MIEILDSKDCCGCTACQAVCPVGCITLECDADGFAYPKADRELCTGCGLCDKVCPVLNRGNSAALTAKVYAAINRDDTVRLQSSSGGMFSILAQGMLERGGVVLGACFDEQFRVVHRAVERMEDLHLLRGSKYTQSDMGDSLRRVRELLKQGREVLFSGTPCQIAGLRRFLRRDYPLLTTVDVACHGVPSPQLFQRFLQEQKLQVEAQQDTQLELYDFTFRDKQSGWKHYNVVSRYRIPTDTHSSVVRSEMFARNAFMRGFLHNLFLRPSCYDCPSKNFTSGSDMTIADYWGIEKHAPQMDDDRGTSLVVVLTPRGRELFETAAPQMECMSSTMVNAIAGNHALVSSEKIPARRDRFYTDLRRMSFEAAVARHTSTPLTKRVRRILIKVAKRLGVKK